MKPSRLSCTAAWPLLASLLAADVAAAEIAGLGDDGWYRWRVAAVAGAPDWCCFDWNRGRAQPSECRLDDERGGFGSYGDNVNTTGRFQVYVRMESGDVEEIRTLSPSCPVTSRRTIVDLGVVAENDSVAWLRSVDARDLESEAIASIAVHAGRDARDAMIELARRGETERREEAIFWMAQVRIGETGDEVRRLMFADDDPDIREHAAFAYAQSDAPDRADQLVRQGRDDASGNVRAQAWFWLAQTDTPDSEAEILRAIATDEDHDVREEAVFALSQLPDKRAVRALLRVIEDTALDTELRKEALFWLAQTESDEALAYFDRLLTGVRP